MDTQEIKKCQELYSALVEMALSSQSRNPEESAKRLFSDLTGFRPELMRDRSFELSEERRVCLEVARERFCGETDSPVRPQRKPVLERICAAVERLAPSRGVGGPK